jgi:hypothetical protein
MNPRYKLSDTSKSLAEVGVGVVCRNTRFVFDQPVTCLADEELELDNGQWFLIKVINGKEERIQLDGKWEL